MIKNSMKLAIMASLLMVNNGYALENLSEDDLSQSTGQDGISVAVILPVSGWTAQEISLTDKTGIPSAIKPGYDFFSGTVVAKNVGVRSCFETAINGGCTNFGLQGINIDMDVVGDANGNSISDDPMLNLQVDLLNASKLRVYVDKIALRNGLGGNESTIIDFNHPDAANGNKDYFDLLPSGGGLFTLQLGSDSTGHMISFGTTNIAQIDFGEVRLTDKMDTGVGGNNRNLRFNLLVENINLTGAGFDVGPQGLIFTSPNLDDMNVRFNNISAGASPSNMGSIGIEGLDLTNHALVISGKI